MTNREDRNFLVSSNRKPVSDQQVTKKQIETGRSSFINIQ